MHAPGLQALVWPRAAPEIEAQLAPTSLGASLGQVTVSPASVTVAVATTPPSAMRKVTVGTMPLMSGVTSYA